MLLISFPLTKNKKIAQKLAMHSAMFFRNWKQVVLYSFIYYIFIYSQTDSLENLPQFQLYMQYASALKLPFFNLPRIDIVTFYVAIPPCFEKRIKPQAKSFQQVEDYTITACV